MAKKSKWHWQGKTAVDEQVLKEFKEATGLSNTVAALCLQRNIDTKAALENFMTAPLEQLHDPFDLYDMQKAVERIMRAIENGERILIYGDYDADGITSTAILSETLDALGADVHYYLPNRFIDGYGPNEEVFAYMIDQEKTQLIITVDNGVSGHAALQLASDKGVDVIVSDHHELPDELPVAYAIIHPRHPNGNYPFKDLSGAGVAFKLATALLGEIPIDCLDIVSIGTIADLVPLQGENRILAMRGIDMLKQTQRVGVLKLYEALSIDVDQLDEETIGFQIAPLLNAIGRLDDAMPAVELLLTFDESEAETLVSELIAKNETRKQLVESITHEVFTMIDRSNLPNCIVLSSPTWHEGVLGIVASRIVEQTGKPTILLKQDDEKQMAKGSGRSIGDVNLHRTLTQVKDLLTSFGGHHMAAGLSLSVGNIGKLRDQLQSLVPKTVTKTVYYDAVLTVKDCQPALVHELNQLKPFGVGNEKPLFLLNDVIVEDVKAIGNKEQHLKARSGSLDLLKFFAGDAKEYLKNGVQAQMIGHLSLNTWNQLERVQLMWEDLAIEGIQYFDLRSNQVKPTDFSVKNALYVFFDPKYYEHFKQYVDPSSMAVLDSDVLENTHIENLVLFDCPKTIQPLETLMKKIRIDNAFVRFYVQNSAYLMGNPTRQHFAVLYKLLSQKEAFVIREQLANWQKQLNVSKNMLILMIQVFSDAKFVTIKNGVIRLNPNNEKSVLEDTDALKKHKEQMATEQQLIYSEFSQLCAYLGLQIENGE